MVTSLAKLNGSRANGAAAVNGAQAQAFGQNLCATRYRLVQDYSIVDSDSGRRLRDITARHYCALEIRRSH